MIEMKAMKDHGYDYRFSAAITAASSTIGPVIPPSIPFVIYGYLTEVSVGRLFLVGVIPGALMGLTLMIAVFFYQALHLTILAKDWTPVFNVSRRWLYGCMPVSGCIMVGYSIRNILREALAFWKFKDRPAQDRTLPA